MLRSCPSCTEADHVGSYSGRVDAHSQITFTLFLHFKSLALENLALCCPWYLIGCLPTVIGTARLSKYGTKHELYGPT